MQTRLCVDEWTNIGSAEKPTHMWQHILMVNKGKSCSDFHWNAVKENIVTTFGGRSRFRITMEQTTVNTVVKSLNLDK